MNKFLSDLSELLEFHNAVIYTVLGETIIVEVGEETEVFAEEITETTIQITLDNE
jgi:hypothetical protein